MRSEAERRLAELQQELTFGERRLRELEVQQAQLRETLLRIDGAVQVLHQLLGTEQVSEPTTEIGAGSATPASWDGRGETELERTSHG